MEPARISSRETPVGWSLATRCGAVSGRRAVAAGLALAAVMTANLFSAGKPPTLREAGKKAGILVGAAVDAAFLEKEDAAALVARECGIIVAENSMKWSNTEPQRGVFDFGRPDKLVAFSEKHGIPFRGHTLVWHRQLPDWVTKGQWTRETLLEAMRGHIKGVAGHFRGKLVAWDVVNEAISDAKAEPYNELRDSVFLKVIGPDYIAEAFGAAREADPEAKLYYNDYAVEHPAPKFEAMYQLVKGMLAAGVPIDGVGLQCHFAEGWKYREGLDQVIRRLQSLGLEVSITELDVRLKVPATEDALAIQAESYRQVTSVAVERGCAALLTWGITDRRSWIPNEFKGFGAGLPFDEKLEPKPAHKAMIGALLDGAQ